MQRPWGEEKSPKHEESLGTASALLCFVKTQACEYPFNPICRDHAFDLGTGTRELLSGPKQGVMPNLGLAFVLLAQLICNLQSPCLSLPGDRTTGVCVMGHPP